MSLFTIDPATVLTDIIRPGQAKIKQKINETKLSALKTIIEKWAQGFTKQFNKYQYYWEGEVSLEAFDLKSEELPFEFKTDYFSYLCINSYSKDLSLLNKYELICQYATSPITINDREFHNLLIAAKFKNE